MAGHGAWRSGRAHSSFAAAAARARCARRGNRAAAQDRQSARRIAVRAPADGVVIEKPVQEGMRIEPGQALYKTADLRDVWLIAEVQEQDLGLIRAGAKG